MTDIVITAPVLARSPQEAEMLLRSVEQLAQHRHVMLADGGSIDGFTERLLAIPGVTVRTVPGSGPRLVTQVLQALTMAQATGCRYVIYTEPDKRWFFENRLATFLNVAQTNTAAAGIYLSARDAASFATFPQGQQTTERLFNTLASETLQIRADLLYGPLLIRCDLLPCLEDLPPDIGWGWRIFLLTAAHRSGLAIFPWEADLPCPPEQQGEDDERSRTCRIEQMAQNVRGLALGRRKLLRSGD